MMDLIPTTDPPTRYARWCPRCRVWLERCRRRRCRCGAAVVRQTKVATPRAGELRPGVIAEFADPRDRYNPSRELAAIRARLIARIEAELEE